MSRNYERFIFFSHLYLLDLNTYQFDFKLHYLAYIIFMSLLLDYFFLIITVTVYLYVLTSALGLQYVSINLYLHITLAI